MTVEQLRQILEKHGVEIPESSIIGIRKALLEIHAPLKSAVSAKDVKAASEIWRETLRHFRMGRSLLAHEETLLGRAIQSNGLLAVQLALEGARYEPKSERFDPADHVSLDRYLSPPKSFQRFLNLGTKARQKAGGA